MEVVSGSLQYDVTFGQVALVQAPASVPVPASILLMGAGLFGVAAARRRKRV